FGPVGDPNVSSGANREPVFNIALTPDGGVTVDDWGGRYMAFMALGGTGATIPPAFLLNVSRTLVFGDARPPLVPPKSANMLSIARELCIATLSTPAYHFLAKVDADTTFGYFDAVNTSSRLKQLWRNGDAEMWLRLCSFNNPPPIQPYMMMSDAATSVVPIDTSVLSQKVDGSWAKVSNPMTGLTPPTMLRRCAYEPGQCTSDMSHTP